MNLAVFSARRTADLGREAEQPEGINEPGREDGGKVRKLEDARGKRRMPEVLSSFGGLICSGQGARIGKVWDHKT